MRYTAVHVGVDRARHSRQVLLPDSFLNTTTLPPRPSTFMHSQSKPMHTPPSTLLTRAHTQTRTQTSTHTFHSASCGDRLGCLQQWACHMLMYSSTHSNWRSRALKSNQSPAQLMAAIQFATVTSCFSSNANVVGHPPWTKEKKNYFSR